MAVYIYKNNVPVPLAGSVIFQNGTPHVIKGSDLFFWNGISHRIGFPDLSAPVGMTSASNEEWEVGCSSKWSDVYHPYFVFDNNLSSNNAWCSGSSATGEEWILWKNRKQKVLIRQYTLCARTDNFANQTPTTWRLEGSDDGINWTQLDNKSNQAAWSQAETRTFRLAENNRAFYCHRIAITTAVGSLVGYCEIKAQSFIPMPSTKGLVFYAPLTSVQTVAATGQALTTTGIVEFKQVGDISCAGFDNRVSPYSSEIRGDFGLLTGSVPRTLSFWFYREENINANGEFIVCYGSNVSGKFFGIQAKGDNFYFSGWNSDFTVSSQAALGKWQHIAFTYDGMWIRTYFNGVASTTQYKSLDTGSSSLNIGGGIRGCVANVRAYDRVLSMEELAVLAGELIPGT